MEPENGMEQWMYTVAVTRVTGAAQCKLNQLVYL